MLPLKGLLSGLLLVVSLSGASASPRQVQLANGEWPPYVSPTLEQGGPISQLIASAFANEGITTQYTWLPWVRGYRQALNGDIAGAVLWSKSAEREKYFYFSDPVLEEENRIYFRKGFHFDWQTEEDLANFIIGANTGYFYNEKFAQLEREGKLNVTRVDTEKQLIEMLLKERLDIIVLSGEPGLAFIRAMNASNKIVAHPKSLAIKNLHLIFSKKRPDSMELLKKFNRGLKKSLHETSQSTGITHH